MKETLQEVTQRICNCERDITFFELGAKCQQERSYNEEDMKIAFDANIKDWICFDEFIEQFKKK